jgi:hypothetical protein
LLDYYVKGEARDATITITDKAGKTVRTLRNLPHTVGVVRTTWDLRYDAPTGGGRGGRGGGGGGRGGGGGPYVLPGEYTVTLRAGGQEQAKTVKVEMDPRVPATAEDLQAQLEAALTLRDLTSRANAAVDRANSLVTELTALQQRLRGSRTAGAGGDLATMVDKALEAVKGLRDDGMTRPYPNMGYRQYPRIREEINSLSGAISRAPFPPTEGQALRMRELAQELDGAVAKLNQIQSDQIAKINEAMKSQPFITVETIK